MEKEDKVDEAVEEVEETETAEEKPEEGKQLVDMATAEKKLEQMASDFIASVQAGMKKTEEVKEVKEVKKDEMDGMTKEEKSAEFIKALISNDGAKLKVMSAGTSADGGYTIPDYLFDQIAEEILDSSVIRPLAKVIANCPAHLDVTKLVGRPISYFRAEKAIKHTSSMTFDQVALTPYSLYCIVPMTNELIEDSEAPSGIVQYAVQRMGESIADREERAFASGDGSTQPTGIDSYSATVARITATPANVITSDSLITAFYKLGQAYRRKAVWLMTSETLRKVRQLKDDNNRYLFIENPNNAMSGTLLGRPVYEENYLANADIWLGDMSGYWIGDRGGISVAQSTDATLTGVGNLFEQNMTAIRVEKRVDAEMVEPWKFSVITGAN